MSSRSQDSLADTTSVEFAMDSTTEKKKSDMAIETEQEHSASTTTGDIEKQMQPSSQAQPAGPAIPPPPDGGWLAWSQVIAGFFAFFNSWGVVNAFGAYQDYYQTTLLKDQSPSTIAWIGSIQAFMVIGVSVFTGRLLDAGYLRPILYFGAFMLVFGLMMTSLATEFYQIFLAQGVCVGIGCSCFFSSALATAAPYFKKRRSLAVGCMATGSSMGGVIYPIMAQKLIPSLGFPWATRVIAFMVLGLSVFPCVMLKSRIPPRRSGPLIDMPSLTDWPFVFFSFGTMFAFIGLYVPIFYIEAFASTIPVTPGARNYIVSILSAGSVFGRLVPNFLADKTGCMNMLIPAVASAAVLTFCWIAVKDTGGLLAFSVLYGFMSGGLVSIPGSAITNMTNDMTKLGTRLGMNFGLCSLGVLIGAPVAGAIINRQNGDFLGAQLFGGVAVIIAVVLLCISRQLTTGGKLWVKA